MSNEPYISVEQADEYHSVRQSYDDWFAFTESEKLLRLVSASDFIDYALRYIGKPETPEQYRAWPRLIPDSRGRYEDEAQAVMPSEIMAAVCELALLDNISGSMASASKLSDMGAGILLKGGDCNSGCDGAASRMAYAARLLDRWRVKNIPILRG